MKIVYGLAIALTAVSTVCGQYGPLKGSATRRTTTPFPPGFKSDNEIYNGPGSGYSDNSLDTPNASSAPGVKGSTTPSSSGFQKGPTGSDYVPPSLFGAPGFPQSGSPSFNVQLGSFMHPDNPWLNRVLSNGGTGTGTGTGLNFTVSGFNPDTFMMLNNPFLSRVFSNGNVQPGPFGSGPEDCNAPGFGCVLKYQCQNGQTSQPDSGSKKCNLNTEVCCKLSGAPSVGKPGYPGSPGTPAQSIPTGQPGPNEFSGHLDANRPFKQPVHGKQSPNQFEQSSTPSKDHGGFSKSTTQPNYANSISHPDSQGVTTLHKQPSYDKSSGFPKSTKKPGFGDTTYSGFTEKSPPFGYTSSQSSPSFIGQPTSPSPTDSSNYQTPFDQQNQPSYTGFPGSTGQSYRPGNLGSQTYPGSTGSSTASARPGFPNYPGQPGQPSPSGSPQYPGSPGQPGQPSYTGSSPYPGSSGPSTPSSRPGFPDHPGQPSHTGSSQRPGLPGLPGQPPHSGSPQYPGSPGQPGQPSQSGSPQYPGSSGQPDQPSHCGSPQNPGSTGSSTSCGRPSFPKYSGPSKQSNQPSYVGSTSYPGSAGTSSPFGRPGSTKYPGSSSQTNQSSYPESSQYPGSSGQSYQPGKGTSPSHSGSTVPNTPTESPDSTSFTVTLGQPSYGSSTQYPGSTGHSGSSSRPGFNKHPGSPSQSGKPSQPGFPQYPGSPGSSTPSSLPGFPNYLGSSGQTGQPSQTGSPQRPGLPGQPGQPSQFGTSPYPGSSGPSTSSSGPDSTSFSVTLGQPNQPSYSGSTQYPGSTGFSGPSDRPGFPKYPGSPAQPGQPSQTGSSPYPGSSPTSRPGFPNYPGQPGQPQVTGSLGQPGQPSYTGSPQRPGSPGQPGQPSHTGSSSYPGSSGPSTPSSRPDFPNYPGQPGQPSQSGLPSQPGQPSHTGSPQYPGSPGQAGQPSQTGSSPYPGSSPTSRPGFPNYPGQPGQPQVTGSLGQPGQPSYTGSPQRPGSPGQPGQPSHTGSSSYPGSSNPSTPSSRPGFPSYPGQSGQPSQPGSSPYPGSPGRPGQPSQLGVTPYPGSPGSSTPSSRPGFPNFPGSPGQPNQPSYGGSTPYPGSTGLSGPSGRPGFPGSPGPSNQPSYPGSTAYPGSVGQTYQPGKYGSPSYAGSTSKPPQFGYNSLTNIPGSNGAPISGSIYDNLSGFQYGTNNVTESPNGPYTGPLNTTPHVGCPAALKCVEETYCTWDGVMSDTPVILTKEQAENRVPLSECQNIETGIIGKCCRDPNYEDPWPSDVTHGEGHFGDHGHDHSGHPDKGHNHHHHPNHRDQQGINLITCGSSEICTPQDQCTGGRHVNSVKRCSLPKGDSTGVCCKKQTNAQGSSSQTTVTPSASSRQPSSSGLRPQQPKNPFLSNALNKPGTLGQGNRGPDSFNNNLFTDAFSSSYPISGTTVGTPSPKGNVYSNTAQNSLDNFTEKPSSPGQLGPYSASSKPAFSVTTDLSSQTVRPALPGRTTVRPGQTIFSTTPGSSSNLGYTGYTGSSDRPKQPGFSTTGLSTQSNRNSPFGSTSLPNRVNQPQGIGKTQPTGQQGPNNFIVSSTTSRGESGYYSFTTASPNTPSDFKYTGSTPKPNEPSSFQSGQPGTFDTSTPQSYSNKPGGSLGSTVQPGLSQFGLNSNPSSRPDITLHTSFLGSTLPSRPTQNLDLLKNTPKPTFSITTQSPNDSGATKYEYVFEQSSQTIQPGLISTTPSPYSGNNYRGSTSQTILSTGAPSQQPSNKPISGQEFSLSLPTANRSPGTFSSTTAFPGSSSFGDSPHLRPSFPLDTKRTPDRVPSVFGFNAGIYNTPSTPSGRPKGPPPGFPFSQSPTVTSFKSTVSYETGKSCGIRGQVERPNGPNGLETGFGEFPWQAQVLRSSDQSGLCHGAIISDRAVITSAYCLNDLKSDDLMVKVGDWKLGIENPSEEPKSVQIRFVAAIVKHPKYDPVSRFYDMAVLLIEEPFAFDSHVGALCVGDPSNDNQLSNLNNCVVSGWKKQNLKETTKGSVLQSIPVNFVEPQQCANTLQSTFLGKFFQLHKASTCIRPVDGQHKLCEVDTGSPVACQTPDGRYELAGVYSWDVGCPASSDVPAVTSNVDKTWVNEAVQKQIDVAKKEEEDERERLQTLGFNPNESDLTKPGFSQGYGR